MKTLVELVKKTNELRQEKIQLKAKLEEKEIRKYLEWKEENPKARTAMEKVLSELKMSDEEWQDLEEQYQKVSLKFTEYSLILSIAQDMIKNSNYTKEDVNNFLNELIGGEI